MVQLILEGADCCDGKEGVKSFEPAEMDWADLKPPRDWEGLGYLEGPMPDTSSSTICRSTCPCGVNKYSQDNIQNSQLCSLPSSCPSPLHSPLFYPLMMMMLQSTFSVTDVRTRIKSPPGPILKGSAAVGRGYYQQHLNICGRTYSD